MAKKLTKAELAAKVVEPIREAMAEGDLVWLRGWKKGAGAGLPYNPARLDGDGNPWKYTGGVNILLMLLAGAAGGFGDPRWMTFRQGKAKGWKVRKGQRGTKLYRPDFGFYTDDKDGGKQKRYVRGFIEYTAFNGSQFDGIPSLENEDTPPLDIESGFARTVAFTDALGCNVVHSGDVAKYTPALDQITMPPAGLFEDPQEYWSTRLHETGHWTGHKSRMDRGLFGVGMEAYAKEELVAELFAAFACADLGIEKTGMTRNHAAYLKSWHRRLGEKPELFMDAVNDAWKALVFCREKQK
jgi:antirestriction protein ArdC